MSLDGTKTDGTRIDGGGFPGLGEPPVVTVPDGRRYRVFDLRRSDDGFVEGDPRDRRARTTAARVSGGHLRQVRVDASMASRHGCASRRSARSEGLSWSPRSRARASGAEKARSPTARAAIGLQWKFGYNPFAGRARGVVFIFGSGPGTGNCTLVLVPPGRRSCHRQLQRR